jgi:hypothetical protein
VVRQERDFLHPDEKDRYLEQRSYVRILRTSKIRISSDVLKDFGRGSN